MTEMKERRDGSKVIGDLFSAKNSEFPLLSLLRPLDTTIPTL